MTDPQEESLPSAFNLDELRLMPAWMKEEPAGQSPAREYRDAPVDRRGDESRGGPRQGGNFGPRPGGGNRFDNRGPRPGGGGGPRGDRSARPGRDRDRPRRDDRDFAPRPPVAPPVQPAAVRVEFLPDQRGLASIAKQIRAAHLAYPLFGMARMFLSRPERHLVRLSVFPSANGGSSASLQLFQLGEDGPVTTDRAALEKIAFDRFRDQYYATETVQKEPPKGNFSNVARDRNSGTLLGPTNHHAYQTNLRALYDARFSRRMSFEQFRGGVEVVTDPALVERWKEETRTTTVFTLRSTTAATSEITPEAPAQVSPADADVASNPVNSDAPEVALPVSESAIEHASAEAETAPAEPAVEAPEKPAADPVAAATVIGSLADARAHFRQHYFDALVRSGPTCELPGEVARTLPEPSLMLAIRLAHESEIKYPGGLVQPLRAGLQNAGLHVFKHRKRVVYVSAARPTPFRGGDGAVSENVAAILDFVTQHPLCTRKALAEHLIPQPTAEATKSETAAATESSSAEPPAPLPDTAALTAKAKAALAADLRYLVQAGHIIEFHNGTFDLPLPPKPKENPALPQPAATTPAESMPPASAATTALENLAAAPETQSLTSIQHSDPEPEEHASPPAAP